MHYKQTEQLYRGMKMSLRLRKHRKRASGVRVMTDIPIQANRRWSIDSVMDQLANGRRLKCVTLVDDFTRGCLAIAVDVSVTSKGVIRVQEAAAPDRALTETIDYGDGRSLPAGPWIVGRANTAWGWRLFSPANQCRTRTSCCSTASFVMNA